MLLGLAEMVTRLLEKDWAVQGRNAAAAQLTETQPPAVRRPLWRIACVALSSIDVELCPFLDWTSLH